MDDFEKILSQHRDFLNLLPLSPLNSDFEISPEISSIFSAHKDFLLHMPISPIPSEEENNQFFSCKLHKFSAPSEPCMPCFFINFFGHEIREVNLAMLAGRFKKSMPQEFDFFKFHVSPLELQNTELPPFFYVENELKFSNISKSCKEHIFDFPSEPCLKCLRSNSHG